MCDPLDLHVNAVIDHGIGAAVTDVDGNTMLDLSSGLGCLLVGHSHPKVVEAVQRQAAKFSHTDFSVVPYEVYVELAERLVERVGPRPEGGAVQLGRGGRGERRQVRQGRDGPARGGLLRGRVPRTDAAHDEPDQPAHAVQARVRAVRGRRCTGCRSATRTATTIPSGRSALADVERAFTTVVDPDVGGRGDLRAGAGRGRLHRPRPEFLPGVRGALPQRTASSRSPTRSSRGSGARAGSWRASTSGLDPDIVILAKALAAGYPLSAVVGRSEIMDAPGPSAIGGTYVGNPVACAAANAVLDVIEEEGLIERAESSARRSARGGSSSPSTSPRWATSADSAR